MEELADLNTRTRTSSAQIDFSATDRKTKRLIELQNVAYEIGGRRLFEGLNFIVTAGLRVGLVGPNGSGKTTLLRLLRGEVAATEGEIRRADKLRIVYFDQRRELDPNVTLRRALAPEGDSVIYQDRVTHVASWAAKFLFKGEQLNQPVERLSGGERARVLIAQLMLQPADVLLLDEPTNDLDIPTLEILEESLLEFRGSLVLVTHDRYMLDRVSTIVLGLDGRGGAERFADYSQWEAWQAERQQVSQAGARVTARAAGADSATPVSSSSSAASSSAASSSAASSSAASSSAASSSAASAKKKLSYLEAREYASIEQRVADAEQVMEAKRSAAEDPAIASDGARLMKAHAELEEAQNEVNELYARWAELEKKQQA